MSFNTNFSTQINQTAPQKKETEEENIKIVQFADEERLLPDGSRIIYAESKSIAILLFDDFLMMIT